MDLYLDEFMRGIKETMALHKQGESIFEMGGGNLFPTMGKQQMWQFSKAPGHIHFSDGMKSYSFKHEGELNEDDLDLEKIPDVPLPDLFKDSTSKGKAQVHRSDPGSIYFTLQEGTRNPTYTFKHTGGQKWKAIAKKRKAKEALKEPAFIANVNAEAIKEGMLKQAMEMLKSAEGGALDFFNRAAGGALNATVNAPLSIGLAPGRVGGAPAGGLNAPNMDTTGQMFGNAAKAGVLGAGVGLGYHGLKRHFWNTPEENAEEDPNAVVRRMALPALGMAGANMAERSLFPNYYRMASEGHTPTVTAK